MGAVSVGMTPREDLVLLLTRSMFEAQGRGTLSFESPACQCQWRLYASEVLGGLVEFVALWLEEMGDANVYDADDLASVWRYVMAGPDATEEREHHG